MVIYRGESSNASYQVSPFRGPISEEPRRVENRLRKGGRALETERHKTDRCILQMVRDPAFTGGESTVPETTTCSRMDWGSE